MPGVLKSSEDIYRVSECSDTSSGLKSRNMAYEGSKTSLMDSYGNGVTYVNGGRDDDITYMNGTQAIISDSQPITAAISGGLDGPQPPEIEHITFGYLSLSTLITRLVQETFNGLTDAISEMSELQVSASGTNMPFGQVNPLMNGNGAVNSSHANVQKKLRMLNFAQEYRAQFIKILVLTNWSRQAQEIGKVIDLKIWLDGQRRIFEDATWWMGELKRTLGPRKMPNPDLKTALETLSLGKATWLPDLGYIPPTPLSPQQIIKALRNINTLLSIRLNLYEKIPPLMRKFSISSGRATFHVHEEFEVDLSIADEDPSSQLYFIDFRFIFVPTPNNIPESGLRREIEDRTNEALKLRGLDGCFQFLHDLVLTYKISILRNQAFEMTRGLWSEHLKVELVHRSLIVQYWLNRPGGKNWIEIGIKRKKDRKVANLPSSQDISLIAIRCFRSGKEVLDAQINLDLSDLSLQKMLKKVIAMHTNTIFEEVAVKIGEARLYAERLLKLKRNTSVTEPLDSSLLIQLTPSKAVKITLEPVTGKFVLQPASHLFTRLERELNNLMNPAIDVPFRIASLRCKASQEEVETHSRLIGWEEVKSLIPGPETMKRLFPPDTLKIGFFRRKSWSSSWILAFTTSMAGDSWWIVNLAEVRAGRETESSRASLSSTNGSPFKAAYKIPMVGFKSLVMETSHSILANIESTAVGMISNYANTLQLKTNKIEHKLGPSCVNLQESQPVNLYIRFAQRPVQKSLHNNPDLSPWANEIISLNFKGVELVTHSAIHTASARLKVPIKNPKSLTSSIDDMIAFHPTSGDFAFRLLTTVGESTTPLLLHRLSSIERLIQFLSAIRSSRFSCETVSLTHIEFAYASLPDPLKAKIHFPPNVPMSICFEKGNPHIRIQDFLASLLRSTGGLEAVVKLLGVTLPLLRALLAIETSHSSEQVKILPRSAEWYHVRYENPRVIFNIRLKQRRGEMMWALNDLGTSQARDENEKLAQGLNSLGKEKGDGWRGMKGGMISSPSGVVDLVEKIDQIYQNITKEKGDDHSIVSSGKKRKAEDEVVVLD